MDRRSRQGGFTLTELLVAIVIFASVMSGISLLFSGVVRTVRQTYQTNNAFELVRSSFSIMEEDLQRAFTAREWGRYYQFYGGHRGFVFVGLMQDGQMGRVTYAIHPSPDSRSFRSTILESWREVRDRLYIQARQYALAGGASDEESVAHANDIVDYFEATYPSAASASEGEDELVEFEVSYTTYALLRFEEPGKADLESFDLDPHGFDTALYFTAFDPVLPSEDEIVDLSENVDNELIWEEMLSAVNPTIISGPFDHYADLRESLQDALNAGESVYAVNPAITKQLFDAKRREIWLKMVAGDPLDPTFPTIWNNNAEKIRDHTLADRILEEAILLDLGAQPFSLDPDNDYNPVGLNEYFDVLMTPPFFNYGAGENAFSPIFNDIDLVPGYISEYQANPTVAGLLNWDAILVNYIGSVQTGSTYGSPLSPRIPEMVRPGFWIVMEKAQPGLGDFRRWFTQTINVPSGAVRGLPSTMTPSPGRV